MPNTLNRSVLTLTMVAVLGGCSTLPRDGPSGRAVDRGAVAASRDGGYAIVNLDYTASERIKTVPAAFLGSLAEGSSETVGGLIGIGDTLSISIFEPGGTLFGGGVGGGSASTAVRSGNQALPPITVDGSGSVNIPFGGTVRVANLTPGQAAAAMRRALIGKVGNPQVLVAIAENASNTVTVLGDVRQPGRSPLKTNGDRILDVIAERGGTQHPPEDVLVRIQRKGQTYAAPLSAVTSDFSENIRLANGDQINLVYQPRHYSTFGALGAVSRTEMGAGPLNLAGAISKVGGLDTNTANARSVLIFRFERPEVASALGVSQIPTTKGVPIVYRLNLEEGTGFFIANNFQIQPEDILYVPRSGSAELGKFFTLVQTVTRVVYDVSVTSTLNSN